MIAALAVALGAVAPRLAAAQDAPTAEQLAQAKQAFLDGRALHDKGDLAGAVEKFKESFRLSRNPVLLYNIAFTFEELGQNDLALFYYKKYLSDAPAADSQRPAAEASVKKLDKGAPATDGDGGKADGGKADGDGGKADGGKVDGDGGKADGGKPPGRKPKRTAASVDDFEHKIIEEAPPGKPLDLTAYVPEDSGWGVTLYYRGSGDSKFTGVPMRERYNELVGRIPAAKMGGTAVQYYLELHDDKGEVLTRIGKSTSPNVVYIDTSARPRYYPDLDETTAGGAVDAGPRRGAGPDDENPIGGGGAVRLAPTGPGFTDVGSKKFGYVKWGATGGAIGMLALSMTFYLTASNASSSLEGRAITSSQGNCAGGPPCDVYDSAAKDLEASGKRGETISKVTFTLGVAAGAVAGWYWYKEIKARKKAEKGLATATGLRSLIVAPLAGEGLVGGAAALRF
ncbi:MAG: hypothetical protein H6709_09070 [Kofleriaceae bacterium]|nr:hypothetical protein [Myxococcales bacterium]MCB9563295.1 hypothetical protein [Kofleriaceae bacterium]MCB9572221.1 hypothetical protein [Kofleriaceae bacterium]